MEKSRYEATETPELWLVNAVDDRLRVFRLSSSTTRGSTRPWRSRARALTAPVVPGFGVDLAVLFNR